MSFKIEHTDTKCMVPFCEECAASIQKAAHTPTPLSQDEPKQNIKGNLCVCGHNDAMHNFGRRDCNYCECAAFVTPPTPNGVVSDDISLCENCGCMTHTIDDKCGKCGVLKDTSNTLKIDDGVVSDDITEYMPDTALDSTMELIATYRKKWEAEARVDELEALSSPKFLRNIRTTITDSNGEVYTDDSHMYISKFEVQERILELKEKTSD